jgi:hypothetical protein
MPNSDLLKPARRISRLGQLNNVRFWRLAYKSAATAFVRYWRKIGHWFALAR